MPVRRRSCPSTNPKTGLMEESRMRASDTAPGSTFMFGHCTPATEIFSHAAWRSIAHDAQSHARRIFPRLICTIIQAIAQLEPWTVQNLTSSLVFTSLVESDINMQLSAKHGEKRGVHWSCGMPDGTLLLVRTQTSLGRHATVRSRSRVLGDQCRTCCPALVLRHVSP